MTVLCGSAKGLPYPNGLMRLVRRKTIPGFERKVVAQVWDREWFARVRGTYHGYSHFLCVAGNAQYRALFAFNAPLHSTHLFYLADDAEELLAKLAH